MPAAVIIALPVAGSKPKLSHTSAIAWVRSWARRSGKTPTGESLVLSNVSTPTTSRPPAWTSAPPNSAACRPVAQACSTWKPGIRCPMQLATRGAFQNFQCQGIVEPMIRYSSSLLGTFLRPSIRFIASPANCPILTWASADVCQAGKKLLPQVPKGILAFGNM
jgi:hypothetical protein